MPVRRSTTAVLAVLSVAQFLIALDYSIIYVALPSIGGEFGLSPAVTQWVVSAYAVLFAGFLVVGGRLTDRVGPKQMFILAMVVFGAASAVGGAAQDGTVLLVARGAQGVGAALLQPAILGLIGTTFPAGPERSRALAVWGSVGAMGLAAGVVLGGLLTTVSWRLVFEVNVPLTLGCAAGAALWVGSSVDRTTVARIPLLASVLGTATVLASVVGLTISVDRGWGAALTLGVLAAAVVLFAAFVVNERTSRAVLIEPPLRRTPSLRTGAAATALYMASVGSEFYLVTLLLQDAKGYSPLRAGLAFLPLALMVTAGSTSAGRAVRWMSPRAVLFSGFCVAAVGLGLLSVTFNGDSYAIDLLPGLILSGFGHGVIYTSMFIIGTADVPSAYQGTAGALLTTSQYLSGALTIAVLTLILEPSPGEAGYRTAFLVITAAALAGAVLSVGRRRGSRPAADVPLTAATGPPRTPKAGSG